MVNNVGTTTETLSIELGRTTEFNTSDNITVIAGTIGKGFLLFDSAGTLGVVSEYTDETNFIVSTYALSIDIENILSLDY